MILNELINVEKVKQLVKERTAVARGDEPKSELSPKAQQTLDVLKCCAKEGISYSVERTLVKICSILLDEKLPYPLNSKCSTYMPIGVMIVPLIKYDGHNYELGKPVLARGGSRQFLKQSGCIGNNYSIQSKDRFRYATDEEIDEFFKCYDYSFGKAPLVSILARI